MKVRCGQCGAMFEDTEACCPYCGAFNYKGAEEQYMQQMGEILEDLDDLHDLPEQIYEQEKKRQVRHTGKIVAIVIGTVLILAAIVSVSFYMNHQREQEERRNQVIFQQQNFAQLDQWYEAEEYEKIIAFENELHEQDSPYNIYSWKHYQFYSVFTKYLHCQKLADYIREEDKSQSMISIFLVDAFHIMHVEAGSDHKIYSKRDKERISTYAEEVRGWMRGVLQMTEEEIEDFADHAEGSMDFDYCDECAAFVAERLGGSLE